MGDRVVWEEPPPLPRVLADRQPKDEPHEGLAGELKEHPRRWARLNTRTTAEQAEQTATDIQVSRATFRPPGAFEAVPIASADGYAVYVRYVGARRTPDDDGAVERVRALLCDMRREANLLACGDGSEDLIEVKRQFCSRLERALNDPSEH